MNSVFNWLPVKGFQYRIHAVSTSGTSEKSLDFGLAAGVLELTDWLPHNENWMKMMCAHTWRQWGDNISLIIRDALVVSDKKTLSCSDGAFWQKDLCFTEHRRTTDQQIPAKCRLHVKIAVCIWNTADVIWKLQVFSTGVCSFFFLFPFCSFCRFQFMLDNIFSVQRLCSVWVITLNRTAEEKKPLLNSLYCVSVQFSVGTLHSYSYTLHTASCDALCVLSPVDHSRH